MLHSTLMIRNRYIAKSQKGLVLFVALIALVAMSLAAAALVRSVDSSVLVAGNLAFKQSATLSAETSIEVATLALDNSAFILSSDSQVNGYLATVTQDTLAANFIDLTQEAVWNTSSRQLTQTNASGAGLDANGRDIGGNSIRYIVQRMCRNNAGTDCLFGKATAEGNSKGGDSANDGLAMLGKDASTSPIFRITSRVDGPKNTVSYIQVYTY